MDIEILTEAGGVFMESLMNAKSGEVCTIKWMVGNPAAVARVRGYDIEEGSQIQVIQQYSGSVIIGHGGVRLALDKTTAERIKI